MRPRALTVILALLGGLLFSVLLASSLGAVRVPLGEVSRLLLSRLPGVDLSPTWSEGTEAIIMQIRLPRVASALVVGWALATAGVVFQGLLRNPMADPYIIGTSGGAALGATIALLLPVQIVRYGFTLVPLAAFVGALAAVLLVYNLARVGPRTPVTTLLLAGFAVSSMLAAIMSFLLMLSGENLRRIIAWTMGGLGGGSWPQLLIVTPLILLGMGWAYLYAGDLDAFSLGEEQAAYLGVPVERRKFSLLVLGSLLTASAVSISGLVGFVGLVIPHLARLLLGPGHRLLLPASALLGGLFLVLCDMLARVIMAPAEIPVGTITALVGAPFFVYLLRRSRKEYAL